MEINVEVRRNSILSFMSQGILQIASRAIFDIMPNALQQYSLAPPPSGVVIPPTPPTFIPPTFGDPPSGIFVIQPNIDVHSSFVIDPGLISISMAYGYMRAAEILAFGSADNALSPISDEIVCARLKCWAVENDAFSAEYFDWIMKNQTNPPLSISSKHGELERTPDDAAALLTLRKLKFTVRNLVCQYQNAVGFQSSFLPTTDFRSQSELKTLSMLGAPYNSTGVAAWWMQFERHPYSPPIPVPWVTFVDGSGQIAPQVPVATVTELLNPCSQVTLR